MALRIRATSPVYCGKCGKRRGLLHTCIVRRPSGRTTVKAPTVTLVRCGRCGAEYANPLTHVCPSKRGDFARRRKAAERRARQAEIKRRKAAAAARRSSRPQHRYETCHDDNCQRITCRAFKEGYANGYEAAAAAAAAAIDAAAQNG